MTAQMTPTQKDILCGRTTRMRGHTYNWTNEFAPVRSRETVRAQWVLDGWSARGVRDWAALARLSARGVVSQTQQKIPQHKPKGPRIARKKLGRGHTNSTNRADA